MSLSLILTFSQLSGSSQSTGGHGQDDDDVIARCEVAVVPHADADPQMTSSDPHGAASTLLSCGAGIAGIDSAADGGYAPLRQRGMGVQARARAARTDAFAPLDASRVISDVGALGCHLEDFVAPTPTSVNAAMRSNSPVVGSPQSTPHTRHGKAPVRSVGGGSPKVHLPLSQGTLSSSQSPLHSSRHDSDAQVMSSGQESALCDKRASSQQSVCNRHHLGDACSCGVDASREPSLVPRTPADAVNSQRSSPSTGRGRRTPMTSSTPSTGDSILELLSGVFETPASVRRASESPAALGQGISEPRGSLRPKSSTPDLFASSASSTEYVRPFHENKCVNIRFIFVVVLYFFVLNK